MRKYVSPKLNSARQEMNRAGIRTKVLRFPVLACVLVLFFAAFPAFLRAQNNRQPLRTIREVNQLSNIAARDALPVQLEAVATYSDPEWGLLFIEDATGAIYVNVHGMTSSFPAGSRVHVEAVTGSGDVGSVLVNPHIEVVGQAALPSAERRSLADLDAKKADSRFVVTHGVLRAGDEPWKRICFRLFDGDVSALVVIPRASGPDARRLVGATVRVRGISAVHIDAKGKIVGALIFVNHLEDIEVESGAAQDPNALAVIVNKNNPITDMSAEDFRQILLGDRQYWKNYRKIVLLLPSVGSPERETALRLLGMKESDYKKHWTEQTGEGRADLAPAAVPSSGIAVNLVAETVDAIAVVPLADVKGSVKLIKIDGRLPSESGYTVH